MEKTTLANRLWLAALTQALGRAAPEFDFDDFYTTVSSMDVSALPIIHIDIEIRPDPGKKFSTNFSTEFADDIIFDSSQQPLLIYRTQARYEQTEESIVTEYFTLRTDGTTRPLARTGGSRFAAIFRSIWSTRSGILSGTFKAAEDFGDAL